MRTLRAHAHGLTNLAFDFDGTTLPDGLIALVGEVGSGKTTAIDVIGGPAILFRELSTKPGGLRDYCNGPAVIDVTLEYDGATFRHLIQVDPEKGGGRGETKAYLWKNGVPQGEGGSDGSTKAYDAAVLAAYPWGADQAACRDVFYASAFADQEKGGSFFNMVTPAGLPDVPRRKALFATLLGLGEMQRIADRAGELRKTCDAKLAELDAKNAALLEASGKVAATKAALLTAEAELPQLEAALTAAQAELTTATRAAADAQAQLDALTAAREAALARLADLDRAITVAEGDAGAALFDLQGIDTMIADADATRGRAERLATARSLLATLASDQRAADSAVDLARQTSRAALQAFNDAVAARDEATRALRQTADAVAMLAQVEATTADYADLRARVDAANTALGRRPEQAAIRREAASRNTTAAAMQEQQATQALAAARQKAGLLGGVPCRGLRVLVLLHGDENDEVGDADCGTCRFLGDARQAEAAIPALEAAFLEAVDVHTKAREVEAAAIETEKDLAIEVQSYNLLLSQLQAMETDRAKLDGLRLRATQHQQAARTLDGADTQIDALSDAFEAAKEAEAEATRKQRFNASTLTTAQATVRELATAEQDLRTLESAEARRPGVIAARSAALQRLQEAQTIRSGVTVPQSNEQALRAHDAAVVARQTAEDAVYDYSSIVTTRRAQVARLRGALDVLGDTAAQQATVAAERAVIAEERTGAVLVEQAFGLNGIQALEIDAAGPEVSGLANELLAAAFGPRFTVSLRTIREAGGGRIQKEVFDVVVLDGNQSGNAVARSFTSYSGGEKTLLDEAIRLALAIFNARRHGAVFDTLYRDEMDSALGAHGVRYPSMLRAAMTLGNFSRVIFISHAENVWTQADAVLRMDKGRMTVEAT